MKLRSKHKAPVLSGERVRLAQSPGRYSRSYRFAAPFRCAAADLLERDESVPYMSAVTCPKLGQPRQRR